jgi:hypothetical protein
MQTFQQRLGKLNQKALRFGLEEIQVTAVESVAYRRQVESVGRDGARLLASLVEARGTGEGKGETVLMNRVSLRYPLVKLGDWTVVGKVEAVAGGCLVFCVTQEEADAAEIRSRSKSPMVCDHCRRERRRSGAFVLREDGTGNYMQVGSACLKDFTGIDPGAALFLAKLQQVIRLCDEEAEEFARSWRSNAVETMTFLADVSFLSERGGFVSAARARETGVEPTYSEASRMRSLLEHEELRMAYVASHDEHLKTAQAVRAWVLSKACETDFEANTKLLLESDHLMLKPRHLALAAATVAMYRKSTAEAKRVSEHSVHVGQLGHKRSGKVTVERVLELENAFSRAAMFLVLMKDEEGNRLAWKSAAVPREVVQGAGKSFEVTFKVKAHGDYKGVLQTEVSHLKVIQVPGQ